MKKRPTKRSACRHETGHAIVALILGHRAVGSIKVWRNRRGWVGQVNFAQAEGGVIDRDMAFTGLMVVIAGVLAENPDLEASEIEGALPPLDLVLFSYLLPWAAQGVDQTAVLGQAVEKTKAILSDNQEALNKIAAVLFRRKTISGQEVNDIVAMTDQQAIARVQKVVAE